MNMRLLKALATAFVIAFAGMVRCGLAPLSGGGTETGNPEMLVCARSVFAEVDSAEHWSVAAYLPGGEQQLDPNFLLEKDPVVPRGKRAVDTADTPHTPDTLVIVKDSNFLIISIVEGNTISVIDTLYDSAAVVRYRPVYDTVFPVSPRKQSSYFLVETMVPDTIKTIAPVYIRDSIVVPPRDTMYFPLNDSTTVFQLYSRPNSEWQTVVKSPGIVIFNDISMPAPIVNPTDPYRINAGTSASLSRTTELLGTTIVEKYSNADDDGLLFSPDFSEFTSSQFDKYSRIVDPAQVIFSGTYTTGGARKTALSALFDAGGDYRLATTADNRLLLLSRQKTVNFKIAERISYEYKARDSSRLSPLLTVERYPLDGAISGQTVWFHFLSGPDPLDHRQNRLGAIAKEISWRSGNLWKLKIQIDIGNPELASAPRLNGKVTAQFFYNAQGSGTFSGVVDKASGKLQGIYTENGVSYPLTYHRSIDWLEWEADSNP